MINLYTVEYEYKPNKTQTISTTSILTTTYPLWNNTTIVGKPKKYIMAESLKDVVDEAELLKSTDYEISKIDLVVLGMNLTVSKKCSIVDFFNPGNN